MSQRPAAADDAAYFTFARFGQPNPVLVALASPPVRLITLPNHLPASLDLVSAP